MWVWGHRTEVSDVRIEASMPYLTIGRARRDLLPIAPSFLADQLNRTAVKTDLRGATRDGIMYSAPSLRSPTLCVSVDIKPRTALFQGHVRPHFRNHFPLPGTALGRDVHGKEDVEGSGAQFDCGPLPTSSPKVSKKIVFRSLLPPPRPSFSSRCPGPEIIVLPASIRVSIGYLHYFGRQKRIL